MSINMGIHRATQVGDIARVSTLLEQGENINALDEKGVPPIYYAVCNNHVDVLQILLKNNALVNQHIGWNTEADFQPLAWTALHAAAENNNVEAATLLLDYGADVDAVDQFGRTPLFASLDEMVGPDVAKILVSYGADVNARSHGSAPIHSTKIYSRPDLEQMLKDAGATDYAG